MRGKAAVDWDVRQLLAEVEKNWDWQERKPEDQNVRQHINESLSYFCEQSFVLGKNCVIEIFTFLSDTQFKYTHVNITSVFGPQYRLLLGLRLGRGVGDVNKLSIGDRGSSTFFCLS